MKHLRELRLTNSPGSDLDTYSGVFASCRSYRKEDIIVGYVKLIHEQCPSIRYIKVEQWSWRIECYEVLNTMGQATGARLVKLIELDMEEDMSVELFRMGINHTQCGLVGPEETTRRRRGSTSMSQEYEVRS